MSLVGPHQLNFARRSKWGFQLLETRFPLARERARTLAGLNDLFLGPYEPPAYSVSRFPGLFDSKPHFWRVENRTQATLSAKYNCQSLHETNTQIRNPIILYTKKNINIDPKNDILYRSWTTYCRPFGRSKLIILFSDKFENFEILEKIWKFDINFGNFRIVIFFDYTVGHFEVEASPPGALTQ